MLRSYYWALENLRTLKRYAVVLVASPHMSHECRKNGLSAARLRVVPYFPPNAHERSAQPTARGVLGTNVLLVGRLVPLKGGIELVDAIALAGQALERRLHLDVAGDGPERDALVSRAKARGIDIHLHGWLDATRLARLMKSVDILAVPSLWPEPFGVVGIEAGYCGLPSVAFATGGIPSWLRPGLSGELAPTPPSVGGLADAIVRALRDPAHLDALRLGAWQVGGEFSCERHITGVEEALVDATRPSKMAEIDRGPELADPESTC
jgi:glycosyltransferase involved in cell wall biosynthesis